MNLFSPHRKPFVGEISIEHVLLFHPYVASRPNIKRGKTDPDDAAGFCAR